MNVPLVLMSVVFGVFMFLGMPLSFAMIFSSLAYLLVSGKDIFIMVNRMFTGIDTFTLMAIPFFMLAGELMVYSGTAEKLLKFSNVLVGRYRGGLGFVNILASMLFGGCSGSAIADVAGLGPLEIKMMEKGGYGKPFSTALTISSAIQGPIIPPSIPIVLIGAVTGTSIGGLLLGGAIPGIMVGVSQGLVLYFVARKRNFPRDKSSRSLREIISVTLGSIPFLLMPFIILGGIIGGIFTPTEASAVAVTYGLLLILVYKRGRIDIHSLVQVFKRAAVISGAILLLSGASNIFGWILSTEKIPVLFSSLLLSLTDNVYVLLFIINIFLLIWGMFMDSLPAIMILAPILSPLAVGMGMHPIHFGVVMTFNLVIGLITPPYGAALFTGVIVSGLPMEKIIKEMIPFVGASIVILFLITYFPGVVMYLPTLLGLHI